MNFGKQVVQNAALNYLGNRGYSESDILKNGKLDFSQSAVQLITQALVNNGVSQNNSIIYSCTTRSITQIDVEFNRLKSWIFGIHNHTKREELKQILFPLFFHIYLNAVHDGISSNQMITDFFIRYQPMFLSSFNSYKEILMELAAYQTVKQIDMFSIIRHFRSNKFTVRLTPSSLTSLIRYLTKQCEDPMIFLNILESWFNIEDIPETGSLSEQNSFDNQLARHQLFSFPNDENDLQTLYSMLNEVDDEDDFDDLVSDVTNELEDDFINDEESNNVNTVCDGDAEYDIKPSSEIPIKLEDCDEINLFPPLMKGYDEAEFLDFVNSNEEASVRDILKTTDSTHLLTPYVNPLFICKLKNSKSVSCAYFSTSLELIATGSMDSKIQLWSIGGNKKSNNEKEVKLFQESFDTVAKQEAHTCTWVNNEVSAATNSSSTETLTVELQAEINEQTVSGDRNNLIDFNIPFNSVTSSNYVHSENASQNTATDEESVATAACDIGINSAIKTDAVEQEENMTDSKHVNEDVDDRNIVTMRGHQGPITGIKLIDELGLLVSVSHDATMRVWSLSTFSCRAIYVGHGSAIWCLDVSPLNIYIATGSRDKTARLWTLDRTYPLRVFAGHLSAVTSVKFHPNAVYLATGSSDHTIRLFTISDGNTVRLFLGHTSSIHCLTFSPDGSLLASGGTGKLVHIWDLTSGQKYLTISLNFRNITSLNWTIDAKVLAVTFLKRSVAFYSIGQQVLEDAPKTELIASLNNNDYTFIWSEFSVRNTLLCVVVI